MERVGVVPPEVGGVGAVGLHPHVDDVGGVAGEAAGHAGEGGDQEEGGEGGGWGVGVARGLEAGFEDLVDAEAGCGVGCCGWGQWGVEEGGAGTDGPCRSRLADSWKIV